MSTDSILAAILDGMEERMRKVLAEGQRSTAATPATSKPLSLAQLAKRYGVGRRVALQDIATGRLKCIERRCRGGRTGVFVSVAEAERIYNGRR